MRSDTEKTACSSSAKKEVVEQGEKRYCKDEMMREKSWRSETEKTACSSSVK